MTALEAEIRRIIDIDGPIPVAQFMALCLAHPTYGYYRTRDPFGVAGDFVTAPEISQMFGELIGLWGAALWQQMGAPDQVLFVEFGPGRGTLMADALRAARILPDFLSALDVHLIETSPALRERQHQLLAGVDRPIVWHDDARTLPDRPMIGVANEFFDALPVHQAIKAPDGWHERMIGVSDQGNLSFAVHPDPIPGFEILLPNRVREAQLGSLYEWRSDTLVTELAERVAAKGGAILVVDYGHGQSGVGETLQAVHAHGFADPLARPGEVDLTAHVDFARCLRAARQAGAAVYGPLDQGTLLQRLGIDARAAALKASATAEQSASIDAALRRLTGPAPGMGELFKAIAIADPSLGSIPGFDH